MIEVAAIAALANVSNDAVKALLNKHLARLNAVAEYRLLLPGEERQRQQVLRALRNYEVKADV